MKFGKSNYTFLFSIPSLFFGAILLFFVGWNLYNSFFDRSFLVLHPSFVGLGSFVSIFRDINFVSSLDRSMIWSGLLILAGNGIGILLASLIFFLRERTLKTLYTSIFIYPLAVSSAAVAVIWTWLFNIHSGYDSILRAFHLPTSLWLDSSHTAFWSLILVSIWMYAGLSGLFYLASFQNIDRSVLESTRIDSSGPFRKLFVILLPNSKNAFIISTALLFLFALRIFSLAFVSTGINPATETSILVMYRYFETGYSSEASAVSMIVVVIAAAIILPYALYGLKRWINAAAK